MPTKVAMHMSARLFILVQLLVNSSEACLVDGKICFFCRQYKLYDHSAIALSFYIHQDMPLLFNLQVINVSYDYIIRVIITTSNYIDFNQLAF